MKQHRILVMLLSGLLGLAASKAGAVALIDPVLVTGSNAIDPAGSQTVDQVAAGAVSASTLEALSSFASIQDFTGWQAQPTVNYVVFTIDSTRPHIKATYSGGTGSSPGGATTSSFLQTSPGASIGLDSGATRTMSLTLDFGKATMSGTTVTSFDSAAMAPTAVGFTVCGLANVTTNVTVKFYGSDDTTVLSTQTLLSGTDPDAGDGTTYGSDGYVGYSTSGTGAASAIGKVVVTANQVVAGNNGIAIDDIGYNTGGNQYFMTVSGSGSMNGADWADAYPATQLLTMVNTTMVAGDTLFLGSGAYGKTNVGGGTIGHVTITSSGTAGALKHLVGVDTGSGLPSFDSQDWNRVYPTQGFYQFFTFSGSSSYWELANININKVQRAVGVPTSTPHHQGLAFRNITVTNAEHGFYLLNSDNMTLTNCAVLGYAKHAFRLDTGCNTVTFNDCTADLDNGDVTWWDYSEIYPFGFTVGSNGANSNITFNDCLAQNNRMNDYGYVNGVLYSGTMHKQSDSYWNGDGFSIEANTSGTVAFNNCVSVNNEDGGYDCKPTAVFTNCSASHNKRGFRCWDTVKSLENCVAAFPFTRSYTNPSGAEGGIGIWIQNGTVTADFFTFYGNAGTGVQQDDNGSTAGTGTVTNSILALSGTTGSFTAGTVTSGTGTVTFRPGSGTDPDFVNPVETWDGINTDMNNLTYGLTKGWTAP